MDGTVRAPTLASDPRAVSAPPPASAQLAPAAVDATRTWHRRVQPHLDHLARIVYQLETLDGERLRATLRAALDCTDDDLLPLIVESEAVLYPAVERASRDWVGARRMLRVDQRVITELRHELRGRLAGDLDDGSRAAIRERLYALHLLLRSQVVKHEELIAAALAGLDKHEDDGLRSDLSAARSVGTTCSDGDGACGCGHGAAADDPGKSD